MSLFDISFCTWLWVDVGVSDHECPVPPVCPVCPVCPLCHECLSYGHVVLHVVVVEIHVGEARHHMNRPRY